MKQGMMLNRWITIQDKAGQTICRVCVRADSQKNVKKRLDRMVKEIQGVGNEGIRMSRKDPDGLRLDKVNELDQKIIDAIQKGFAASDISPLFEQRRPTEEINGRFYSDTVVNALLEGLKTAINSFKQSVTVQIDA